MEITEQMKKNLAAYLEAHDAKDTLTSLFETLTSTGLSNEEKDHQIEAILMEVFCPTPAQQAAATIASLRKEVASLKAELAIAQLE